MITTIEDYFTRGCGRCERFNTTDCSTQRWQSGIAHLRRICYESGLDETLRWAQPCYRHVDRNIAIIGALRADFRLNFFNAALMKDSQGVLEYPGPNSQHRSVIRFNDARQVESMEALLRSYLEEAKGYAQLGLMAEKTRVEYTLPEELLTTLEADPELASAFYGLTPGRQRSYVIALASAKRSDTRFARIERYREKILLGKGAMER